MFCMHAGEKFVGAELDRFPTLLALNPRLS